MHTTRVRNEQAYYCCIAQLLGCLQTGVTFKAAVDGAEPAAAGLGVGSACTGTAAADAAAWVEGLGGGRCCPGLGTSLVPPRAAPPVPLAAGAGAGGAGVGAKADGGLPRPLYVFGDSHSLCPSWQQLTIDGQPRLLLPALVTGLKAWHIRPESTFYPKRNYEAVRASLPRGAQVVMLFCEIDCREGLLVAVERCTYVCHGVLQGSAQVLGSPFVAAGCDCRRRGVAGAGTRTWMKASMSSLASTWTSFASSVTTLALRCDRCLSPRCRCWRASHGRALVLRATASCSCIRLCQFSTKPGG